MLLSRRLATDSPTRMVLREEAMPSSSAEDPRFPSSIADDPFSRNLDSRLKDKDRLVRDVQSRLRSLDDEAMTRALRSMPPVLLSALLTSLER
jgi:hypothetical protein